MAHQVASKLSCVLLACALAASTGHTAPADLETQLAQAVALYERAQAAGFAWQANGAALNAARSSLAAGDKDAARQHIVHATALANAALDQAQREAHDWQTRAPFAKP